MKRTRSARRRRGALLIIVLSILVLFALIALTFVVVAGSFQRAAKAAIRVNITDDEGRQLVERAFMDLLRGNSSGGVECLLEDLWGTDALIVSQFNAAALTGNQMTFTVETTGPAVIATDDAYAGRFITHIGRANGASSQAAMSMGRIRMSKQVSGRIELYIEPLTSDSAVRTFTAASDYQVGDRYLISGRPYSGTDGGPNESYDAVDALNPFLAYIPADLSDPTKIVPSFIDRALVDTNSDGVPDTVYSGTGPMPIPVVDNDRDGVNDSVWINLGLPRKSTLDGRTYQPYVAFLCLDLDGRLNANSQGNANHSSTGTDLLGQGVGPAEIRITSLPNWSQIISSRNGTDGQPGATGNDPETDLIFWGGPKPYDDTSATVRLYGSPMDIDGDGRITLDATGQPQYANMLSDTVSDSPYELTPTRLSGQDALFTAADMERILRWWDVDAMCLSQRLKTVLGLDPTSVSATQMRQLQRSLTTHSAHIPVPRVPGGFLRLACDENRDGSYDNPSPLSGAQIADLFPREAVEGGKMDLNRPWDPTSTDTYNRARHAYAKQLFCLMMFSMDRDPSTDKLIYRIPLSGGETLTDDEHHELTVRRIAQWAVNAVDFRDPDAVMSPFEYDMNPFDGWATTADGVINDAEITTITLTKPDSTAQNVSHYLSTGTVRLVWGCEYPDLIMTESLALHDRRTKDTNADDNANNANEGDPPATGYHPTQRGQKRIHQDDDTFDGDPTGDKDLDQFRIPLGSLFLEFACMRNTSANDPIYPSELYSNSGQLDLDKLDASGAHPVWRVAVSAPHHGKGDGVISSRANGDGETRQALGPSTRRNTHPNSISFQPEHMSLLPVTAADANQLKWLELERFVWFTSTAPTDTAGLENANNTFVASANGATVAAGQHFVVGPRESTPIGTQPTPSIAPGDQVDAANPINIAGVTHIICQAEITATNRIIGANISEPLLDNHYPEPAYDRDQYDDGSSPLTDPGNCPDVPLDGDANASPLRPLKSSDLIETGTQSNYKTAFLQRLADPNGTWHPVRNPYITVDWKPLDLTVYNGEDMVPETWPAALGEFDPEDPNVDEITAADLDGASERGEPSNPNKWKQFWTMTDWADNNGNFPFYPAQSLGTLNTNLSGGFPWMFWANRPFVGQYDLMLVPMSSNSRLLHEFSINGTPFPYGHLLDFAYDPPTPTPAANSAYYRVLELVEVPSRYAGTQRWVTGAAYPPAPPAPPTTPPQEPNYRYSLMRDPGVINVNTITGSDVYAGLTQGNYAAWADFETRRKGNTGAGDPATGRFVNPVRGPWTSAGGSNAQRTLIAGGPVDGSPLLGSVYATSDVQHPYKYFERVLRLSNLASSQSNVYAVWVTIGYFEVNPVGGAVVRELGADTGEVVRHRGFYIVDRSIPVAFERGKDHNVVRTVLLKRYIE
jgi:hypothetical protein